MRKIALLLALIFVFSACCVACQNTTDVSEDVSQAESGNSTKKPMVLTGVSVSENPMNTIVSVGASYTKSVEAGDAYPDTYGSELTDGIRSTVIDGNYNDSALSGYSGNVSVMVDLGTSYDKIYSFKVGYLSYNEAGIGEPASISVTGSIDGSKWTTIGGLKKATGDPAEIGGTIQEAELVVKGYIQSRYVRFDIRSASAWTFIDEIMVIADVEGAETSGKYVEAVNSAYQTLGVVKKPTSDVAINRDLEKVLVSQGKSYKINGKTKTFSDSGKMLTDGKVSGYYEGETWVGFDLSSDVTVTVDLGAIVTDIASVEATFFARNAIDIYLPVAVKFAAIDDKNNKTDLGIIYGNTLIKSGAFTYSVPFDNAISARYIEFTFVATECNIAMVEELAVYAHREVQTSYSIYPEVVFDTNPTEWGSEASNEYENLIYKKTQQIICASDISDENVANNTPVTSTAMTDGLRSVTTDIHNGRFFKFCTGASRTVIYDLDHISSVDKITASFVEKTDWAVSRPSRVNVFCSVDGINWYGLGDLQLEGRGADFIYKGELVLKKAVKARYISYVFDVGAWVGCDELEVFGMKNSSGSDPEALGYQLHEGVLSGSRIEPSEELLGGAKDLCLMYHSTAFNYTAEELIPYLSYVDAEGKPQDVMFDSFLFLYANTTFPSGARPHENGIKSDWQWTIDDLYADGRNVKALEDAAGQVKTALGLPADYKFKYTVTLYYPTVGCDFGDVDGDGINENFKNYEDRVKAMQWYIDEIEKIDAACNFSNIELVGYYWWHEAIEVKDTQSKDLLNAISDMVHAVDKTFFWIPYYCSTGYSQWAEYGFDVACMQPNYVFNEEAPYSRVVNCANLTALYGMGFEMEIDSPSLTQELFYKKYMQYLGSGAEYGYMDDTIVMYYQAFTIFADAAKSKSNMARNIYDQTYHFIKGDIDATPEAVDTVKVETAVNTPCTGKIDFELDIPREFKIISMPENGTVSMNSDGSFFFYPAKDYTGEITFTYSYNEFLGWSEPCEITVTVK